MTWSFIMPHKLHVVDGFSCFHLINWEVCFFLERTKRNINLILEDFKEMEANEDHMSLPLLYLWKSIFQRSIFAGILVFDVIFKKERLDSSWSTLKPLRFLLWQFKEVKVFLTRFSETSVLIFFSGTPKGSQVTGSI